ncbi:hypothetical protein [Salinimicrobium sp. TH3]|uniref:hypothetical protein n=1 Tax=Salinimicrobium sp. TH3 TaxID=2997342 RepID=UPI002274CA96|nr:hypothetical protein [Salinimicrobium sp. TH3]MCY2686612.1 hypothetical protein [Salinimicrobium sp. TH3]
MQQQIKILLNHLAILLALLSIGGGSTYASGVPEIRKEQPFSSEKFAAANPLSVAYRENPYQDIPELLKNFHFGNSSVVPNSFNTEITGYSEGSYFSYKRDLRKDLEIQLFPKHFFL